LLISSAFLVLNVPLSIVQIVDVFRAMGLRGAESEMESSSSSSSSSSSEQVVSSLSHDLHLLNYAINFYIYAIKKKKFKSEILNLLNKRRPLRFISINRGAESLELSHFVHNRT
jgi:hypothetical protein